MNMNNAQIWFIYLIRTHSGALYTGITTDVTRRFNEHCAQDAKCAKSLRGKGPLTLELNLPVGEKSDALKLEYYIKKLTKIDKELLVQSKKLPVLPST